MGSTSLAWPPLLLLFLLFLLAAAAAGQLHARNTKIDCYPLAGATQDKCKELGCEWFPVKKSASYRDDNSVQQESPMGKSSEESRVNEPWCYYPEGFIGYNITGYSNTEIRLQRISPSLFGNGSDIKNIVVKLEAYNGGKVLRVRVLDAERERFEPELPELNLKPAELESKSDFRISKLPYRTQLYEKQYLSYYQGIKSYDFEGIASLELTISRISTGAIIFSTDLGKLIFAEKFIQLNSELASPYLFGLGEHYGNFLKRADSYKTYSFYNTDRLPLPGGTRSYGGFPFYINLEPSHQGVANAHGVYLRNSHAMDIVLQKDQSISFRPIGGILDFFLFIGPTPMEVIQQFQQLVGLPDLPPAWSLGFHLCRYNYNSLNKTRTVWSRTRAAGIPFDVQWNDIDYMFSGNDFTYDHTTYNGLSEFVRELHGQHNMHYMLIVDPGVSQEKDYYPYSLGEQMNIFVRNSTNGTLVGKVWNHSGRTVFPDFSHPKARDYWSELFVKFQRDIQFDGAWLDMNDISNFVDGSLDGCPSAQREPIEGPPYLPGGYSLQTKSLCLSGQHWAGREYDVHNLYSFYETIATRHALEAARPGRRSLIISRSTHPGQGQFGGHWSGDVESTWDYLRWSIPSLLEHQMYGFSMMGSDICGFSGNTTPELCARWSTLGAFYTFTRNHNDDKSIDQDPVAMGPVVVQANKNALTKRYSLLPYLYTLLHKMHQSGLPVARSMLFEFFKTLQKDPNALAEASEVEDQFMWGPALLISPIVEPNTYTKSTYLTEGRWFALDISAKFLSHDADDVRAPEVINSAVGSKYWHESSKIRLDNLALFYRGGHIIPIYTNVGRTVPETMASPIGLEVALCSESQAQGELILDDGETINSKQNYLEFRVTRIGQLTIELVENDYAKEVRFGQVKVYGLSIIVSQVSLNGGELAYSQIKHMLMFDLKATVTRGHPLIVRWS